MSDSNAIITELEQKFVLSEPTAASKCTAAEDATFRTPVQMLGGLVSPHLHQAQVSWLGICSLLLADVLRGLHPDIGMGLAAAGRV